MAKYTLSEAPFKAGFIRGQETVDVTCNATITGLTTGLHNKTIYVKDTFEITATSETISFRIAKEPEPFSTTGLTVAAFALAIAVFSVAAYYHVRKRANEKLKNNQQLMHS
jgi:carbohydrate-binding DOMON domain-containing protein